WLPGSEWDRAFPHRYDRRNSMKLSPTPPTHHPYPEKKGGQCVAGSGCVLFQIPHSGRVTPSSVSPRPISTSHLHTLPRFQFWPINPMVCGGPYPLEGVRNLILEQASRLDAFSGYPFRT